MGVITYPSPSFDQPPLKKVPESFYGQNRLCSKFDNAPWYVSNWRLSYKDEKNRAQPLEINAIW